MFAVKFKNRNVRGMCELLARMDPGVWYGYKELPAAVEPCHAPDQLFTRGLLDYRRTSYFGEYKLSESGEKMAALLKGILA